jgi:hypothetical protein
MSRPVATAITFLISALAHELVMGCITRKFRGYGFFAMMLQMPIVMVQRSRWVRGRTLLNNVLFWCSMILGLSMVRSDVEVHDKMLTNHRCAPFTCSCKSATTSIYHRFGDSSLKRAERLRDTPLLDCVDLFR